MQTELTRTAAGPDKQAVFVERRDELRDAVSSQLERIYHLAYAQEFVVGLVALLGVVSALFISVLQRRRELGLLRAVGASRGQILRSVLAEASLMGVVGADPRRPDWAWCWNGTPSRSWCWTRPASFSPC